MVNLYPEFNEQDRNRQLDAQVWWNCFQEKLIWPVVYAENYGRKLWLEDGLYRSLTPNTFEDRHRFIETDFGKSDETSSMPLMISGTTTIANRLAEKSLVPTFPKRKSQGFPKKTPEFLESVQPNLAKYKVHGIHADKMVQKRFKRFSIQHGYRAPSTVNQFQNQPGLRSKRSHGFWTSLAISRPPTFLNNVNLTEQFSPLIRIDFEMQNPLRFLRKCERTEPFPWASRTIC